jgi:hypothetical protein
MFITITKQELKDRGILERVIENRGITTEQETFVFDEDEAKFYGILPKNNDTESTT